MQTKTVSILVVDDDKVDRKAISRAFKRSKILNPIIEAGDGLEAIDIMQGKHSEKKIEFPVLVLLDIKMPRMDGIECLRRIREDKHLENTVVFILTTSDRDEEKAIAYDLKVNGYVTKKSAGPSFLDMAAMVDSYWRIVEFPNQKQ